MESGCSPSIRRPRSHLCRKPRLGNHFLFELDNANGLDTLHAKDVLNATLRSKKGAFLQEVSVVRNLCRKDVGSSGAHRLHRVASKANEGTENQTSKASPSSNRHEELYESEYESLQVTRETSHESSEGIANGMLSAKGATAVLSRWHVINTKDVNQLIRQSLDDKANSKPGLSSRTQSHRKRVVPRKFHDGDTTKDRCDGQRVSADTSMGPNNSRDECMKYNVELAPMSECVPPSRKSHTKRLENKMIKTRSSLNATDHHLDERAHLIPERSTTRESPFASEVKRHQHSQEILLDRGDDQNCGDESSGEDAASLCNDQSTPEVERSMLLNGGAMNRGALDVNDSRESQVPTVRKSSRIPKKRILDGDEEAPLRRPRKRLEIEQAIEHSEQEESTDDGGNVQLTNERYERELTDVAGDAEYAHDFCQREFLNNSEISEPFLVEKKEMPLTARQRALRISKEGGDLEGSISVGVPDVSQPILPKRQKENLSEAEQAIKKEEAARRRKQQMEKNAKEIQAVAIQKILGQESSRKKREEKLQKQRQEIEQDIPRDAGIGRSTWEVQDWGGNC